MIEQFYYDDLHIKLAAKDRGAFIHALDRSLTDGWRRMAESEMAHPSSPLASTRYYYLSTEKPGRKRALVALVEFDAETLGVANVVPLKPNHQFSREEYNATLTEFRENGIGRLQLPFPGG
jgi:hypothetical protein